MDYTAHIWLDVNIAEVIGIGLYENIKLCLIDVASKTSVICFQKYLHMLLQITCQLKNITIDFHHFYAIQANKDISP